MSYSNHSDDGIGKDFKNLYKEEKSRRNEDKLNFQEQRKQLEARIQKFKAELTSREASYRQEREEICRMYLQESNLCMHLKEERASRNLFIKEILNVLRQRNKELKKLSKQKSNHDNKNEEQEEQKFSFRIDRSAKKRIRSMFFSEKQNSSPFLGTKKKHQSEDEQFYDSSVSTLNLT